MTISSTLTTRDRKVLLGGVVAVASIVGASRGIPLWHSWDEGNRIAAQTSRNELATLEARVRSLPSLQASLHERDAQATMARRRLIEASTVMVASSQLATQVTDIADELGIKVSAVQIRPDSLFRADYARVAVTLSAVGDVTHLTDLLNSIESSDALLAVRELSVTPSDVLTPDGRAESLRFQILVEGLAVRSSAEARAR